MKFGLLIEYSMNRINIAFFFKNPAENEVERLVSDKGTGKRSAP